jgi:hypothetical protein
VSSIVACTEAAAGINLRAGSHARPAPVNAKKPNENKCNHTANGSAFLLGAAPRSPRTMRKVLIGRPFLMKLAASLGES